MSNKKVISFANKLNLADRLLTYFLTQIYFCLSIRDDISSKQFIIFSFTLSMALQCKVYSYLHKAFGSNGWFMSMLLFFFLVRPSTCNLTNTAFENKLVSVSFHLKISSIDLACWCFSLNHLTLSTFFPWIQNVIFDFKLCVRVVGQQNKICRLKSHDILEWLFMI